MPGALIGYARCPTDKQVLTAQRKALVKLGVAEDRIYLDRGLTGTTRARPGSGPGLRGTSETATPSSSRNSTAYWNPEEP